MVVSHQAARLSYLCVSINMEHKANSLMANLQDATRREAYSPDGCSLLAASRKAPW